MDIVELDEEHLGKISHFQEITNVDDFDMARCTLASVDWNLERAIEAQLNDTMNQQQNDDDIVPIVNDDDEIQHLPMPTRRAIPIHVQGRENIPVRMDVDNMLAEVVAKNAPSRSHVTSCASNGSSSSRNAEPASSRSSNHERDSPEPVDMNEDPVYVDSAEEDDYDYSVAMENEPRPSNSTVPLIPVDSGSVSEALNNFVSVFESRFANNRGHAMPHFSTDSLDVALKEAFEAPGRPVVDRRPFAMYIHSDHAIAANIFAANVLCREEVSSLLRMQYVLWPWDITHKENKVKLIEWVYALGMDYVRQSLDNFLRQKERLPLLVVIIKEKGSYRISQICFGMESAEQVVDKLMMGIDEYSSVRVQEEADMREREERERIRQEQAMEYEASLAADRARIEAKERELQQQREEEERKRKAEEDEQMRRAQLASELPEEPAEGSPGCLAVRFRLPEGEQCQRRFRSAETLSVLIKYLESKGYSTDKYRFFNSDFPKKDITGWDASSTFTALKWPAREQVFVEEQ